MAALRDGGDAFAGLVASLAPAQLEMGNGRVTRLVGIAVRHAHTHRRDIENRLAGAGGSVPGAAHPPAHA